jgi:hypothetical protein
MTLNELLTNPVEHEGANRFELIRAGKAPTSGVPGDAGGDQAADMRRTEMETCWPAVASCRADGDYVNGAKF